MLSTLTKLNLNHIVIYLIEVICDSMRPYLTIKICIVKLKIMKHKRQNIPMKTIQKTHKQTKRLQFPSHKSYRPQVLPDGEFANGVNSLNSKQRKVFNVVHKWDKDYVKCNGHNGEPVYIFLSCSGGTGKSHLVKVIHNTILKTLLYHCKDPEKPGVLLLGSTGISAVDIGGTTIHSGLSIKPGIELLGLNNKSKAASRNKLSEAKFLIIDELSKVLSNLWIES